MARLIDDHRSESSAANALVHEVQWTLPYGSVIVGDCCRQILSITEKPSQQHLVLTSIYVLDDRVLSVIPAGQRYDMPRLLLDAVAAGHSVRAVRTTGEWFDVGTPDTLRQAEQVVDRELSSVGGAPGDRTTRTEPWSHTGQCCSHCTGSRSGGRQRRVAHLSAAGRGHPAAQ